MSIDALDLSGAISLQRGYYYIYDALGIEGLIEDGVMTAGDYNEMLRYGRSVIDNFFSLRENEEENFAPGVEIISRSCVFASLIAGALIQGFQRAEGLPVNEEEEYSYYARIISDNLRSFLGLITDGVVAGADSEESLNLLRTLNEKILSESDIAEPL